MRPRRPRPASRGHDPVLGLAPRARPGPPPTSWPSSYGVAAELWSATSYKRLREEALAAERWNRLHPDAEPRTPLVTAKLADSAGPVVAVTDFMRAVPDQVSRWVPGRYTCLGTDGFGRSDTREALRRFFEIDAGHVVVAVLSALAEDGQLDPEVAVKAAADHGIDRDAAPSWTR